jgi:DNA-binding response OmpR family regulator
LIWSGDGVLFANTREYLTQQDFEIMHSTGAPPAALSVDLVIADIDGLPLRWWKRLSELRMQDKSVALILVSSAWPNFGRLHSWRPCGYLRTPFSMEDLLRVVRDLLPSVQVSHR